MYKQATIAVLIAVTFIVAAAMPATADHRPDSAEYIVGNGLLVVSDDVEGTGLPGLSFGGAFQITNPDPAEEPSFLVVDDVHGDLDEDTLPEVGTAAPLSYAWQCDAGENGEFEHCSVFVGPGGTTGSISFA